METTKIAQIATLPERLASLRLSLNSIYDQVDKIYVSLNGHQVYPDYDDIDNKITWYKLDNSRSDGAKFYNAELRNGYVITLDDDLAVPKGFVDKLISKVNQYKGAVSLHGKIYPRPPVDFRRAKIVYRCLGTVSSDSKIDLIGTGCMAYHTDMIEVRFSDFPVGGMADVWFSKLAWEQNVPMWAIAHPIGYLRYSSPAVTIWNTMGRAELQTKLIKQFIK